MRPKVARMAGIFIGAVPGASVANRWRGAHLHRVLAGMPRFVRYWFTLVDAVDRRAYLATGLGLMAFKYAVDAGAVALATGRFWSPLDYLLPFYLLRAETPAGAPAWFLPAFVLWTLPFLWIGVAMTLRRAVDAGRSPWLALAFFVPLVNYVVMLALCRLPTVPLNPREERAGGRAVDARPALVVYGTAAGLAVALPTILLNVYVLRRYSTSLFLGTPFTLGAVTAYVFNRAAPQGPAGRAGRRRCARGTPRSWLPHRRRRCGATWWASVSSPRPPRRCSGWASPARSALGSTAWGRVPSVAANSGRGRSSSRSGRGTPRPACPSTSRRNQCRCASCPPTGRSRRHTCTATSGPGAARSG